MRTLREDCEEIVAKALAAVQPGPAVSEALCTLTPVAGRQILVSVGKAAHTMAQAAWSALRGQIDGGIVITKYGHSRGPIGTLELFEAGHPIPDEAGFTATRRALELTAQLNADDRVIFLLSGGGSALFEQPLLPAAQLQSVTASLLACGASIQEINTIRKRLSGVKGGRFAQHCAPAQIFAVILSDVLGNRPDLIASGPVSPDPTSCADARRILEKYDLTLTPQAMALLAQETPKSIPHAKTQIISSVRHLIQAAADACAALGYLPVILTDCLDCEARQAGAFFAAIAKTHSGTRKPLAFLAGGETVVHVTGSGKGGRNQELALSAAPGIAGLKNAAVFSLGSDGTDGPTDAAGGFVDGKTTDLLAAAGLSVNQVLRQNDAYGALQATGGLLMTGPTGTNVNDVSVLLLRPNA